MAKRPWIVEAIESPEKHPFAFIFVFTLAISVAGNGISTLLLDTFCTWLEANSQFTKASWQFGLVIILVLAIALGSTNLAAIWKRLNGRAVIPYQTNVKPLTKTFKGLIVFMSLGADPPARTAILHHWQGSNGKLKHCWIICGGNSIPAAKDLVDRLHREDNIPTNFFQSDTKYPNLQDPSQPFSLAIDNDMMMNDPSHIRELIECIYSAAKESPFDLEENEIIIDFTGGLKPTSAGAILAGANPDRRMEYILSDYDPATRKPINSRIMEIDIAYKIKPTDRS